MKPKNWTGKVALDAETVNNYLHTADQEHFRWQVAKNTDHLCKYNLHKMNQNAKNEKKIQIKKSNKTMMSRLSKPIKKIQSSY
jgi:hypothetical protein